MLLHVDCLVEVGLHEALSELLPVGGLENKFLEFLIVASGDGCAALNCVLGETFGSLHVSVFENELAGAEEELEGHGVILLELGRAEFTSFLFKGLDDSGGWFSTLVLGSLLRLFLSVHDIVER